MTRARATVSEIDFQRRAAPPSHRASLDQLAQPLQPSRRLVAVPLSCAARVIPVLLLLVACSQRALAASPLEAAVLRAVREARFDRVLDFGPANEDAAKPASPKTIAHVPHVDVAVIQLNRDGQVTASANVLLSRDYPEGLIVPVSLDQGAAAVRFRRWDIARWNGGDFKPGESLPVTTKGWTHDPPLTEDDDLIPGRTNAAFQFMAPYPASLFKLLVAFHVMRMVDDGSLTLDTPHTFSVANQKDETRPLRAWLDPMVTESNNRATQALLQLLHRHSRIETMNREFRELRLPTLQINGTRAADGRNWQTDRIHMTAFDTARLLLLIEGPSGDLWRAPDGRAVNARFLSESSRAFLKQLLAEQGLNEALSTANLAGVRHVRPGLPSQIAARWINPTNGIVVVDGVNFGVDVRASNAVAEVTFAHKTGLTYNYASDAGIVTSLPGRPFRRYILVFLSNLGYRYVDEVFADRTKGPYADPVSPISYTQRIPALARAIDDAIRETR
ncbi:MAG: serine hydrolase [Verrucomicrobia bacterium]|nr:serine hydrolase [Verrucomicrobiota bacterium]